MAQTDERYFATYCRLDTVSEDILCVVNGDGVAVGVELGLEPEHYITENGKNRVRMNVRNPKGELVGFVPAEFARRAADLMEAGWKVRACTASVGCKKENREFFLEIALFCYEEQYPNLGKFAEGIFDRLGKGDRPDIRLSEKMLDQAVEDKIFYATVRNNKPPKLKNGEAYYKTRRTVSEGMVISGSQRKPGCMVGTIAFYVVLAAIIVAAVYMIFFR